VTDSPVIARLLECAEDYAARALRPRVAWDQMGAETWSRHCRAWAVDFAGLGDAEIITRIRAFQNRTTEASGLGFMVGIDLFTQIDRILDPVDQAKPVGYIELTRSLNSADDRPQYRRMLGVNHCVAGLMRGLPKPYSTFERLPESDADWLERRRAWLARYHPDTCVVRTSLYNADGSAYQLVGRVRDFIEIAHLREPEHDNRLWDQPLAA
jgi:hypothetical protein